jgi:hypothetical protein
MKISNIAYDSITVSDNFFMAQNWSVLGILVQDSIRFQPFKIFAVYSENRYLGNYQISTKASFKTPKFPDIFCRMVWNKPKNECGHQIKLLFKKGRFSDNSTFALVSFHFHSTNEDYKIKTITSSETINQNSNENSSYVRVIRRNTHYFKQKESIRNGKILRFRKKLQSFLHYSKKRSKCIF